MRGYGAPDTQTATSALTVPDWGWGDAPPASWTSSTADYGWGSDHGPAIPSYLELDTTRIGDDGGYQISIRGDFPRRGASAFARPTGFSVVLSLNGVEYPCYSGRAGEGEVCSTDLRAQTLSAYSPALAVGDYSVYVRYDSIEQDAGQISVERRARTYHEYALRDAYPSVYATETRHMRLDSILDQSAPSADQETHTNVYHLTRSLGQSLAEFCASGVLTRITSDFSPSATTLLVESTLGFPQSGGVYVGGVLCHYSGRTETTLTNITRPLGQVRTIPRGESVEHDPHTIAD